MGNADLVEAVKAAPSTAPIPHKLRALVRIAGQVARVGRSVAADDIASARRLGATDVEIHDAVFVAAAFCMFNLCVDGLAALTPRTVVDPSQLRAEVHPIHDHQPGAGDEAGNADRREHGKDRAEGLLVDELRHRSSPSGSSRGTRHRS